MQGKGSISPTMRHCPLASVWQRISVSFSPLQQAGAGGRRQDRLVIHIAIKGCLSVRVLPKLRLPLRRQQPTCRNKQGQAGCGSSPAGNRAGHTKPACGTCETSRLIATKQPTNTPAEVAGLAPKIWIDLLHRSLALQPPRRLLLLRSGSGGGGGGGWVCGMWRRDGISSTTPRTNAPAASHQAQQHLL